IGRTEQDRRIDIREARPDDGPALVRTIAAIDAETDFLGVPGERPPWADRAAQQLREWRERRAAVYMLALRDGEIVGYVGAFAGWFERNRGVLFIGVVGVRAAHWGQGIAKQMLAAIEAWARAHDMWRMELRVDTQNPRALPLYLKHGFVVEGTIPHAVAINGSWRQHHWMGMLLAADDAPRCKPVDLPRLAPPPDIDQVIFRPLRPEDAAALWTWEGAMLAETPFMMKRPAERLAVERLAKNLAEADGNPHRHEIVAAIERQGEPARIVGHGGAWVEPLYRMAHDSWVGVGVLRA
ncbi:MAG: GNAT family N-acetyltransferase, partial [Proteobacteria bacterium]|nr:GNAT family N-acetyltransferase [Pseudomonadota bacterium]